MKKKYFRMVAMLLFAASMNSYAQGVYLDCTPDGSIVQTSGDVSELDGVSTFTFEAMVRFKSFGAVSNIMNKLVSLTDRIALQVNAAGNVSCCVSNGAGTYRNSSGVLQLNKWYHIAMVYNGNEGVVNNRIKLYLDGAIQSLGTAGGTIPATAPSNDAVFKVAGGPGYLNQIDEVRVWNTALDQPTIDAWKGIELDNTHPNYANLKLYWDFDDVDTPSSVIGVQGTAYNGTITSALYVNTPDPTPDPPVPDTSPYHPVVIAYLPYYSISKVSEGIFDHLTHLHYFSFGVDTDGNLGRLGAAPGLVFTPLNNITSVATDLQTLKTWRGARKTKIMVTFGGWVQSAHFDNMAASATARANFIQQAKAFLITNGLDGADIDWEGYDAAVSNTNYGLLLSEMKAAFAGTGLEISVAIGKDHYSLASTFAANVDRIGLMSYGATFGSGMQVSLSQLQGYVNGWINAGAPKNKIVAGLPAFARTTADGTSLTQKYIIDTYNPANSVNSVVDNGKTYYFNGIDAIQAKSQYVEDNRLGGVLLWDEGQDVSIDHPKSVLNAITQILTIDNTTLSSKDFGGIMNQENRLSTAFPNPFNSELNLSLTLSESSNVSLSMYDLEGRIIGQISKKNESFGTHSYTITTGSLPKGFYLMKVEINGKLVQTHKMIKN